jgi:hypothetical protein
LATRRIQEATPQELRSKLELNNSIYIAVLIIQSQEKHLKPLNMLNFEEHLIVNN